VQLIHAGDLAGWILRMAKSGATGVYHATGPGSPHTMEELLATCKEASGGNAGWVWVTDEFVEKNELVWWKDVPFCIEEKERAVMAVDVQRAAADGLVYRSLLQTVRDTLAWDMGRPAGTELAAGLKAAREVELLRLWDASTN
jgi:2'-hydroxyisoflavone reductase